MRSCLLTLYIKKGGAYTDGPRLYTAKLRQWYTIVVLLLNSNRSKGLCPLLLLSSRSALPIALLPPAAIWVAYLPIIHRQSKDPEGSRATGRTRPLAAV
jgi:hypothetical protein